jgi:hypothetical protein
MQLLIGCGSRREKLLGVKGREHWKELVRLDCNPDHAPDVLHDLEDIPLPFDDDSAEEIHAYDVLEHVGRQGDWRFFFAQWSDFWRILQPGGFFFGIVPSIKSPWAWGDPSHTRVILPATLTFLSQAEYKRQVGITPLSDFRHVYKADFAILEASEDDLQFRFALKAIK